MDIMRWAWLRSRRRSSAATSTVVRVVAASLLVALIGGLLMTVRAAVDREVVGGGSLRVIEVSTAAQGNRPLTQAALDSIADMAGVSAVQPTVDGASVYGADGGWDLSISALQPALAPPGEAPALRDWELYVPASWQGVDFTAQVGRVLRVGYTIRSGPGEGATKEVPMTIAATYDPQWQVHGTLLAFANPKTAIMIAAAHEGVDATTYMKTRGAASALIVADSQDNVRDLTDRLRTAGFAASPLADRLGDLPGVFALLPYVLAAVTAIAALMLFSSSFGAISNAVRHQLHDLALMRVNGWSVRDIRRLLRVETLIATMSGAIIGVVLSCCIGVPLARFGLTQVDLQTGPLLGDVAQFAFVAAFVLVGTVVTSLLAAHVAASRSLETDPYLAVHDGV